MLSILNNLYIGHQQILGDYNVYGVDQPVEETNQSIIQSVRINLDRHGIPVTMDGMDESPSKRFCSEKKRLSQDDKAYNIHINNENILDDLTSISSVFDGELGSLLTQSKQTSFKISRKAKNNAEYVNLFANIKLDKKLGQGGEGEV